MFSDPVCCVCDRDGAARSALKLSSGGTDLLDYPGFPGPGTGFGYSVGLGFDVNRDGYGSVFSGVSTSRGRLSRSAND